ncbi:MAG: NAD-dependent epimerase/dehydratase family protein [candidate division Zixibacteria bacterium]|nr:NAD-dependent epimerase/dehydratase family protein [candidate division Zixibacteria bacterium]
MPNRKKHIILGAGGAIGNALTAELLSNDENVRLVSRTGHDIEGAESLSADLTDADATNKVIDESSIVYLMVGLPYDISVWREKWPPIMKNTVEPCKAKNARLLFFDNCYMYGKVDGKMTEETPVNPTSKKGEVRAQIADYLLTEIDRGSINAIIARSADFYGPYADETSIPYLFIFDKFAKGKKPQAIANAKALHSYTYTLDCAKALNVLANDESAYGQVWHLPTASPPLTSEEFISLTAEKLGRNPDYTVMKKWMVWLGGLFDKQAKEVYEMLYQNEYDYQFDSSKFEKHFNFTPTPYDKGIEDTIQFYRAETH